MNDLLQVQREVTDDLACRDRGDRKIVRPKSHGRDGEDKAYETFRRLRWPVTNGEPVCPRCGGCEAYAITTRRRFKCKACLHMYSVMSGTIFASRKLAFTICAARSASS